MISCKNRIKQESVVLVYDDSYSKPVNIDSILSVKGNIFGEVYGRISERLERLPQLDPLTKAERVFWYVYDLKYNLETYEDFTAYFDKPGGQFAHEALDGLKSIKAYQAAAIVEETIEQWPDKTVPKNDSIRQQIIDSQYRKRFALPFELASMSFSHQFKTIDSLLVEYIKANKKEFH